MNRYIAILNDYLAKKTPSYGYHDIDSLLEMLYLFYTEENPIDSPSLRQTFSRLDGYFEQFSLKEQDQIWTVLFAICAEQEKLAFFEGFHVGLRLITELTTGQPGGGQTMNSL